MIHATLIYANKDTRFRDAIFLSSRRQMASTPHYGHFPSLTLRDGIIALQASRHFRQAPTCFTHVARHDDVDAS